MRRFGLIGYPLGHSFSQRFFTEKFEREGIADARYELFPLEKIEDFPALLLAQPGLCGLNVTIPHKTAIIPYLHALDATAEAVGAVNCIRIEGEKQIGFNTDVIGFERAFLKAAGPIGSNDTALVLGNGGAARAVAFVLRKNGISYKIVGRRTAPDINLRFDELTQEILLSTRFIINTTPLGTFPNTQEMPPLPIALLGPQHLVYDLVYNPAETLLLQQAATRGCQIQNGLEMLYLQAEAAWEVWNMHYDNSRL
ncbi:MAG: shikimate dehydrogenase [Chitinophagales bacterium]|nr:shikimate dehydrogenase [Chitinophagales bacterium]